MHFFFKKHIVNTEANSSDFDPLMITRRELKIGNKLVSDTSDCFIIAEIGQNHQGDVETCMRLFEMAKFCGADAVKIQKRHNRSVFTKKFFDTPYNSEHAFGPTYGLHRQALEFNLKEYKKLKKYAERLGLIFFATAWDFKSADFLNELDVECFKIASSDIINTPLLRYIARFKKPMIVSTGTANMDDVVRAYDTITSIHKKLVLMQCTAVYPAGAEFLNLKVIETFRKRFPDIVIGFSNHFNGISVDPVAYCLGARVIEKHFTLDRTMKGSDHIFSLEPVGMRKLIRDLRRVKIALGNGIKSMLKEEEQARYKMGKCILAAKNLHAGHKITKNDLIIKSPCEGILPYLIDEVIGKIIKVNLKSEQPLKFEHLQ